MGGRLGSKQHVRRQATFVATSVEAMNAFHQVTESHCSRLLAELLDLRLPKLPQCLARLVCGGLAKTNRAEK